MGDITRYTMQSDIDMGSVAMRELGRIRDGMQPVDESVADVLKATTLAALLAVPGLVDGAELLGSLKTAGDPSALKVSSGKVQKKIYDAVGRDRYDEAVVVNILARTLMAEAVGERSAESFDAVASVIWNRSGGSMKKMVDVVWKPLQFSCWNGMTDSDRKNFVVRPHGQALTNPSAWKYCVSLAKSMVDGTFKPTGKWTHYYAHNKVTPKWASKMKNVKKINNHTFGTL